MRFNPRPSIAMLCHLLLVLAAKGQYYPGGLGNSNLQLWLDANDLTTITMNGANQVSVWADKSVPASPLSVVQSTSANEPVYTAAGLNSRPSLGFSHTGPDFLALQSTAAAVTTYFQGYSGFSHFCVYNSSDNGTLSPTGKTTIYGRELIWKTQISPGGTGALNLYASGNGTSWGTWLASSVAIPVNSNVLLSAIYNSAGNYSAYNASSSLGSIALGGQVLGNNANNFYVGGRATGVEPFTGDMGELLIYNTNLSTTERIIIENYLSAKWGITLSANVYYTPPTATTYGTNLVGIGYTSAADNFLGNPAGSTDGLGLASSTGATGYLNSAGYLMAADNGQTNTIINNATVPGISNSSGTIGRWNRSWNIQEGGGNGSGSVTLNFNFNDYNGSTPITTYTYAILYNATDGSFATGSNLLITTTGATVSATSVSFGVNAANLPKGYYTLIWSTTGVLPVIFTGFTVTMESGTSLLQWSTSTETGNSQFEIQRAIKGSGFSTIGTVAAIGTNTTPGFYSFIDNRPATGVNTYRLKIVNQDGSASYSPVRTDDFETGGTAAVNIYPNPVTDNLQITISNYAGEANITVFNLQGQKVRIVSSASANTLTIPFKGLAPGSYFIEVDTDTLKYVQEVIKAY